MAKKVAEVDIKLSGLKSIADLEQYLTDINAELKNMDTNSEQFKTLSNNAALAEGKLRTVNDQLKGVTAQQKTEAVKKLGEGMVGAFQVAAGASLLFGEKTSEQLTKVIATVGGLYSAIDGIDKISRVFSAENIRGLKAVGMGFKGLVTSVRTASTAMKTALISTGIGALIVGVGMLIANFDKIKNLLGGTQKKAEEAAKAETELLKAINSTSEAALVKEKQILELKLKQNEYKKDAVAIAQQEVDIAQEASFAAFTKLEALKSENNEIDIKLKAMFGVSKEERTSLQRQQDINKQLIIGLKAESDRLKMISEEKSWYVEIAKAMDEYDKAIKKSEDSIIRINAKLYNQQELYLEQKKVINAKIAQLDLQINDETLITDELVNQRNTLYAQRDAMNAQNKLRIEALNKDIESARYQRSMEESLHNVTMDYLKMQTSLTYINTALKTNADNLEYSVGFAEDINKQYEDLLAKKSEMVNFDKKGREIFEQETKAVQERLDKYTEYYDKAAQIIDKNIEYNADAVIAGAKELGIFTMIAEANQNKLTNDVAILENEKAMIQLRKTELNEIDVLLAKDKERYSTQLNQAKIKYNKATDSGNLEAQKAALDEIAKIEAEINTTTEKIAGNKAEIYSLDSDIAAKNQEIIASNEAIATSQQSVVDKTTQVTAQVQEQSRVYSQLQGLVAKYGEEIQGTMDLISAGMGFISASFDRQAADADARIKKAQKNLDKLNKKEDAHLDKMKDLQNELKDADGERYDEIMQQIADEEAANLESGASVEEQRKALEAQIAADEDKKLEAEYQAAKWRKAESVVAATIAMALGVIKALPNIFLAGLVVTLGVAQIGTILKQKLPERPQKKAQGGLLFGNSHDEGGIKVGQTGIEVEGGEYIVNKNSTARYLPVLESINNEGKKMANGGQLSPSINTNQSSQAIDYDRLAQAILGGIQPVVSVVDINKGQQRVKLIQGNASI